MSVGKVLHEKRDPGPWTLDPGTAQEAGRALILTPTPTPNSDPNPQAHEKLGEKQS